MELTEERENELFNQVLKLTQQEEWQGLITILRNRREIGLQGALMDCRDGESWAMRRGFIQGLDEVINLGIALSERDFEEKEEQEDYGYE